jgi:predicted dehydrogenase
VKKLRLVLAGLGARGHAWADTIQRNPDCDLICYVDPDPTSLEQAQHRFGNQPSFASLTEALETIEDIDATILATPPDSREMDIAAACKHRLPLLVEKPLALNLELAIDYVQQAENAGIPLMIGLNFRYLPVTQKYRRLLEKDAAGQLGFCRFTYERWRNGHAQRLNRYPISMLQPMLWEQSIHHFDLMRFVYQREAVAVYCRSWNPSWTMYADDTNVSALFEFEGGFEINYQGTWVGGWQKLNFEWRTDGSNGVIVQRDMFGDLYQAKRMDKELTPVELPPSEPWVTDLSSLLTAFLQASQGAPIECSGKDHLGSLAMVEACIQSAREGRRIKIDPPAKI